MLFPEEILNIRKEIEKTDFELISALERRIALVRSIFYLKKQHNMPLDDLSRECEMIARMIKVGNWSISAKDMTRLYQMVINISKSTAKKK